MPVLTGIHLKKVKIFELLHSSRVNAHKSLCHYIGVFEPTTSRYTKPLTPSDTPSSGALFPAPCEKSFFLWVSDFFVPRQVLPMENQRHLFRLLGLPLVGKINQQTGVDHQSLTNIEQKKPSLDGLYHLSPASKSFQPWQNPPVGRRKLSFL